MDCQNPEFKILDCQNPEFEILDCQNPELPNIRQREGLGQRKLKMSEIADGEGLAYVYMLMQPLINNGLFFVPIKSRFYNVIISVKS